MRTDLQRLKARIEESLPLCMATHRLGIQNRLEALWPAKDEEKVRQELLKLLQRVRRSVSVSQKRARSIQQINYPEALPVSQRRADILKMIRENQVVIIAGETGSGKTTQIPKFCLEAGLGTTGMIGCTQPRRIAALSVSKRIAEELKVPWGEDVGAAIRFQDKTSPRTRVKVMTDGILLNELHHDPLLLKYDTIIVDEAHERSLNIDFIIGFLRDLLPRRTDLKVIITSATIDTKRFSEAFGNAPVLEVSGRLFPVDIHYRPLLRDPSGKSTVSRKTDDTDYETTIEATVRLTREICDSHGFGDILIFMSGERAIRETTDALKGLQLKRTDILPLFGRLSAGDQQTIFKTSQHRKIIVSTNIAETSITVPGIKYVIDTGLARISRYSPHTRTLRLPIEPVSQSSARQRAGRCGRVEDGICYRLYSEEDLLARPAFTPPEIQRSNLASVILQLLALGIDDIETFPFLEPPDPRSIKGGYLLLRELGAINSNQHLTSMGKKLSRLPVDPTVGRILLQASKEFSQKEVLVIAAGLSIQDPRERPSEKEALADQAHREFIHPRSDFITLLNLWEAYETAKNNLTKNQLRRWCSKRFISFLRMREWMDLRNQLVEALKAIDAYKIHHQERDEDAIHRSILAGLLGNIARKKEGNHYDATHSRKVMLFPGSSLFDRKWGAPKEKKSRSAPSKKPGSTTPEWILSGEWVETQRLYARTVAAIQPEWVERLARHLVKKVYLDPRWDPRQGRVIVKERHLLYGLEVYATNISYGRINPEDATNIFIYAGLVAAEVEHPPRFLQHNQTIREEIENEQIQTRAAAHFNLDERIARFYEDKLKDHPVASLADLKKWLNSQPDGPATLQFSKEEILGHGAEPLDHQAFPRQVQIGENAYPLDYRFEPGHEADGATLRLPLAEFSSIQAGLLDWLIPGHLEEKVDTLLRGLPKTLRKALFPLAEKKDHLLAHLKPAPARLQDQMGKILERDFKIHVPVDAWKGEELPLHLQPRIELTDTNDNTITASREWEALEAVYQAQTRKQQPQAPKSSRDLWTTAAKKIEKRGVRRWTFGNPPEHMHLGSIAGVSVDAWPGLLRESDSTVSLRLFRNRAEAIKATPPALRLLGELTCARDVAWLRKDIKEIRRIGPRFAHLGPLDTLGLQAFQHLLRYLFTLEPPIPLQQERFEQHCKWAVREMKGLPLRLTDRLDTLLELRHELDMQKDGYPGMNADLNRLFPADFLVRTQYTQLSHLERYLKAMRLRADRFKQSPEKDRHKWEIMKPWLDRYRQAVSRNAPTAQLQRCYWLLEEYRVSLFAQELGTASKVSPKLLEKEFGRCLGNPKPPDTKSSKKA